MYIFPTMVMLNSFAYDEKLIEKLKKLGAEWEPDCNRWWCPKENLAKAKRLIAITQSDKQWMNIPYMPKEEENASI